MYGINAICERLQNNLALMGPLPQRVNAPDPDRSITKSLNFLNHFLVKIQDHAFGFVVRVELRE